MHTSRNALGWSLAALLFLASCGKGGKPAGSAAPPEPQSPQSQAQVPPPQAESQTAGGVPATRPARTLPVPGAEGPLPPGHPPLDAAQPTGAIVPPPPGSGTGEKGMTWKVPAGWVEEPPSSSMRKAQYRVPGPGGDGECAVFYFGPGQGGDPMSNAMRWAGQFKQPDGKPSDQAMKTSNMSVGGIPVLEVEVTGTYTGGMTVTMKPAEDNPGYMLLGAVAQGPDASWFFKFTGPEATVKARRAAFEGLIQSLRTGG